MGSNPTPSALRNEAASNTTRWEPLLYGHLPNYANHYAKHVWPRLNASEQSSAKPPTFPDMANGHELW